MREEPARSAMGEPLPGLRVAVVSGHLGEVGGGARAPMLLAERLSGLGAAVTSFVSSPPQVGTRARLESKGIRVVSPFRYLSQRMWLTRYGVPLRVLAERVAWAGRYSPFDLVVCVGLSQSMRAVLDRGAERGAAVCVWETTEALPVSNFLELESARYLDRIDALVVPSATIEANARASYGFTGRIERLPFWVDPAPPSRPPAVETPRHLLFVGRLCQEKGVYDLIDAFEKLKRSRPDATLTIAGEGELHEVQSRARAGVRVLGCVPTEAFESLFSAADVLVLPSHHEGYPLTPLEACARSLPVVVTRVGSLPEIFDGRPCAVLVGPCDPAALASALEVALDPDRYTARAADALLLFNEVSAPEVIDGMLVHMVDRVTGLPAHAAA